MPLIFTNERALGFDRDIVIFPAFDPRTNTTVVCSITVAALADFLGEQDAAHIAVDLFDQLALLSQVTAQRKFAGDQLEPDGTILLTQADLWDGMS